MNPFQAQYPLSPRKFWKKFLPVIIPSILLAVIVTLLILVVLAVMGTIPNMASLIGSSIWIVILMSVLILGIYAWYFKTYIRTYYYEGGDNFITIKKGVFAPREIHVQYQKIQDVYVDQDLLDRIMGLYDVHIASATVASGMEAHIDGVEQAAAEELKQFFLERIQNAGHPGSAPSGMGGATPADAPARATQFSEQISNESYPIQSAWLPMRIIGTIVSSLIYAVLISGYLAIRTESNTYAIVSFLPTFLVIAVVMFVIQIVGLLIWKSNYRFSFTPEYLQYHSGIISQSEQHFPYRTIQDVTVSRSVLERMFGLATVRIENAAQVAVGRYGTKNAGIQIVGQTPESAARIVEVLKPVILSVNSTSTGL